MSRHNSKQRPVSLLDTVWTPGIVTLPSGKPLVYQDKGFTNYANQSKKSARTSSTARAVPNRAAQTLAALANYQPPYVAHQNKRGN